MPKLQLHSYESAGGFVVRDGQILLVRKTQQDEIRMPKGHIEPGEDRAQTALREVTEETGYGGLRILADLGTLRAEFEWSLKWVMRRESAFLMTFDIETPVARDAKDASRFEPIWVPVGDAPGLLTFHTEQEFALRAIVWLEERMKDEG
jgi:8-oxo-dGTP pyrophosphatase MutT (NUDIX family)